MSWARTGRRVESIPVLKCPDCGSAMLLRSGKYGKFYGCVESG